MVKRVDENSKSLKSDFFMDLLLNRQNQESNWLMILEEIYQANQKLSNYQMLITVKKNQPKYSTISFSYPELSDFEMLKKYAGEYGFVVPVTAGRGKKVLKGERKHRL